MTKQKEPQTAQEYMPSAEEVQAELAKVQSMDDFFGKDGVFAKLFASTLEQMLEGELTEHLGYEPYEAAGRNSGNNRNGRYTKKVRTSAGETNVQVPRDRNGEFEPQILARYAGNTNELEEKILAMYAQGLSTRDIAGTLAELYGVDISAATISTITEKAWPLVEACELAANSNRPLARIYPIVYLDAVYIKLRREGRVVNTAVYNVLGVDLEGQRDILGHWLGDGAEGANFWLSVLTDLQNRGVADIFLACVDGLNGFSEAIRAFPPHPGAALRHPPDSQQPALRLLERPQGVCGRPEAGLSGDHPRRGGDQPSPARPALGDEVPYGRPFLADKLAGGVDLLRLSG